MGQRSEEARQHEDARGRRTYVTPAIDWEDELGARPGLVAACGKQPLQSAACDADPGPS